MKAIEIFVVIFSITLSGCASRIKQAYEGTRSDTEISIIESSGDFGFFYTNPVATIRQQLLLRA